MTRFVSDCCKGEKCWCGAPAEHKVEEEIFADDPRWLMFGTPEALAQGGGHRVLSLHPLTAYICHEHFRQMMGPAAGD